MDPRTLVRKGLAEALELLSESSEGVRVRELKEKTSISKKTLRIMKESGLVEFSVKKVPLREISVKRKKASYSLANAGRKLLELLEEVNVNLLRVTPKQLECLKMLEYGKKYTSEISRNLRATLQNLVKRGLVEKRVAEEETTQKVYGKRQTYTITEKGAKAYKTLKTIEAL